jgi:3-oxoadipate enol-lactonase
MAIKPRGGNGAVSWIELNDISLNYELSGEGPSLVLLHELGGSLASFDALAPDLARDFRVLRYDQRGAGLSEKPRAAFSNDDLVRDLARLVEMVGLPPPYRLVGIAAGAAVAVGFALAFPDRVAALGLCAPALTVAPERRAYLVGRSDRAMAEGMRAIVDATLDRSYPVPLRGGLYETYRARFLANDPVGYAHANRALADATVDARLGTLATPSLVLAGRHDLLRPPEMVGALAARLPAAELAVVESGHLMSVQAPDELGYRLRAFFQSLPNPRASS